MGPEALSRSGAPQVWTPNIDRLASEGMYYSHAYVGTVCSVSRSSFMTGMYAVSIGAHNHRTIDKKPLPAGVRTLTGWLRDAGYFTANVVKMPAACGFKGTGKTDWNFISADKPFDSSDWEDLKTHQPFYAQINFKETHRTYKAPAKADPAKVVFPVYYPDDPAHQRRWIGKSIHTCLPPIGKERKGRGICPDRITLPEPQFEQRKVSAFCSTLKRIAPSRNIVARWV